MEFEDYIKQTFDNSEERLDDDFVFDYDIEDMRNLWEFLTNNLRGIDGGKQCLFK